MADLAHSHFPGCGHVGCSEVGLQLRRVHARAVRRRLGVMGAQAWEHPHPLNDRVAMYCALPMGGRSGRGVSHEHSELETMPHWATSPKREGPIGRCLGRLVVPHLSQAVQSLVGI